MVAALLVGMLEGLRDLEGNMSELFGEGCLVGGSRLELPFCNLLKDRLLEGQVVEKDDGRLSCHESSDEGRLKDARVLWHLAKLLDLLLKQRAALGRHLRDQSSK